MAGTQDLTESRAVELFLPQRTENSFAELFRLAYPQMRRYFLMRGFSAEVSEELAQDVMVWVYRKVATVRDLSLFRAWLFKVAQNTLRQYLRKIQNDPGCQPIEDGPGHERVLENAGFLNVIGVLAEDERRIIVMRYIDDLSYEEIAAVLNIPLGTVKWKIFDSKARIQASMQPRTAEHV